MSDLGPRHVVGDEPTVMEGFQHPRLGHETVEITVEIPIRLPALQTKDAEFNRLMRRLVVYCFASTAHDPTCRDWFDSFVSTIELDDTPTVVTRTILLTTLSNANDLSVYILAPPPTSIPLEDHAPRIQSWLRACQTIAPQLKILCEHIQRTAPFDPDFGIKVCALVPGVQAIMYGIIQECLCMSQTTDRKLGFFATVVDNFVELIEGWLEKLVRAVVESNKMVITTADPRIAKTTTVLATPASISDSTTTPDKVVRFTKTNSTIGVAIKAFLQSGATDSQKEEMVTSVALVCSEMRHFITVATKHLKTLKLLLPPAPTA